MHVGPAELLLLGGVVLVVLVAIASTRSRWLVGIIACFAIAVVVTPADPVSTLLVAVPYSAAYVFLTLRTNGAQTPNAK